MDGHWSRSEIVTLVRPTAVAPRDQWWVPEEPVRRLATTKNPEEPVEAMVIPSTSNTHMGVSENG